MAYTVKNMEGRMFKNSRKERASQPDMTGSFVIDDQDFRLAGWWTTPPEVREELNLAADDLPF